MTTRRATSGLCALLVAVGCNQMLDIEEAHVDPKLEARLGGDAEPTEGQAGAEPGSETGAGSGGTSAAATSSAGGTSAGGATGSTAGGSVSSGGSGGGTETTTTGSTSAGGAGGTMTVPERSLCDDYCDGIMEECADQYLQYRDRNQCMTVCGTLPEGTLGQVDENTVACRLKYVGDARYGAGTELASYCRRAGPGGDGGCGSNCEGFCEIMMQVCSKENAGPYRFETKQACIATCEALPPGEHAYEASGALIADGNNVECRLFHVTSAAMLDPEEHCEHAMGITLCEQVAK